MFVLAAYVAAALWSRGARSLPPPPRHGGRRDAAPLPAVAVVGGGARDRQPRLLALDAALHPSALRAASGRIGAAAHELGVQLADTGRWGLLVPLVGVAARRRARPRSRFAVAGFAATWLLLGFGGLRRRLLDLDARAQRAPVQHLRTGTIDTLVVGGAALVPALVGPLGARR